MQIIIEIPEELKSAVYRCGLFLNPTEKTSLINAINNGIPLDNLRTEIERKAHSGQWSDATMYGMLKAVAIIDKYRAESEGKE